MGSGKSGGGDLKVNRYYMSMHVGIGAIVDAVKQFSYGEKPFWGGHVTANTTLDISYTTLHGGDRNEGGIEGRIFILLGKPEQVMPDELAIKLGRGSGADCPAFRGVTTAFFTGKALTDGTEQSFPGFYWAANNPYLKTIWATVQRVPKGLPDGNLMIGDDANPTAIIYESLTNPDWGLGENTNNIDQSSFDYAAAWLFAEGMGISIIWTAQTTIRAFIDDVLLHVNGMLFTNPANGKITLKLIRDDYLMFPDDIRQLNPDNANMTSFSRRTWSETINEMTVTWTNPVNEQEETVTIQDLGNIALQGSVITDSRNFHGFRNRDMAMKRAAHELRVSSAPLASCQMTMDRTGYDIIPGSVFQLFWPEYGIESIIMRVMEVEYGIPGDSSIKLSAVEDVWSLPSSNYSVPPGTGWTPTSEPPDTLDFYRVITLPAFAVARYMGIDLATLTFPDTYAGFLAAQPGQDTSGYDLYGRYTDTTGSFAWENRGTRGLSGTATLSIPLAAEAVSVVTQANIVNRYNRYPVVGGVIIIGDVADTLSEIGLVQSFSQGVGYTIFRGALDTVPKAWDSGTRIWFVDGQLAWIDTTVQAAASSPHFKMLTITSLGRLPFEDAPELIPTLTARPYLPLRPANCKVNGTGFGMANAGGATTTVTWSNRNRLLEDTQILAWTDGTVIPETDQTTTLMVLDPAGSVLDTFDGLTGTSYVLNLAPYTDYLSVKVRFSSKRGSLFSLQSYEIAVNGYPVTIALSTEGGDILHAENDDRMVVE